MRLFVLFLILSISIGSLAQTEIERVTVTCTKIENPQNEIIILEQIEGDGPTFMDSKTNPNYEVSFLLTHYVGTTSEMEEILNAKNPKRYQGTAKRWLDNHITFKGRILNVQGDQGNQQKSFNIQRVNKNLGLFFSEDSPVIIEFQCGKIESVELPLTAILPEIGNTDDQSTDADE